MISNLKVKSLLKFNNLLIKKGNKNKAVFSLLKTLFLLKRKTKKNPINLMYSAIKTLTPGVSTRKTVVAGRLYHLPCSISSNKALYFGCNWLQQSAFTTKEGGKNLNLSEKLSAECLKILKKKGNALLLLKQHNKSVSDNRPFLRFVKRKRSLRLPRKLFLKRRKLLYLKRRKKKVMIESDRNELFDLKLSKNNKPKIKNSYDTKLENKFQAKVDRKFIKIDKKRDLNLKKIILKLKPKTKDVNRKTKFKPISKQKFKNKIFNKKN